MSGIRLEANVHIVTGGATAIANNLKCIEKAGLKSAGLVLDPLAASMAVLSEDEKSLGVVVVDMGGGSCNLVYFVNGSVAHTSVVPVGGAHFTHDVAVGLRTPQIAAEDLKKRFGCALASMVPEDEVMEVEGVGGRKARTVLRREIAEVLEPRAEETLQLIYQDLRASGLAPLMGSGMVLTGGASQLDGLLEMGEFIFDLPVRRGLPGKVGGLSDVIKSTSHATAVGLLLYGWSQKKHLYSTTTNEETLNAGQLAMSMTAKLKGFFDSLF
jgi:cell division protein FtsA